MATHRVRTPFQRAATLDPRTGYPDIGTPDWIDDLVHATIVLHRAELAIRLWRAGGADNPAPLCLLTDAEPAKRGPLLTAREPAQAGSSDKDDQAGPEPDDGEAGPQALPDLLLPK